MRTCDAIVVGGGPAGATCARVLAESGADVVLFDRARFPRDKPCAGWLTPRVFDAIGVTPAEYIATGRTLQPFTAFQTSVIGQPPVLTTFPEPVSYGIRRFEFDDYLLRRVPGPVLQATPVVSLRREPARWIVNDGFAAPVVIGAGGHFCPVSRRAHRVPPRLVVVARQCELRLEPEEPCGVGRDTPELYFSADLEGYGWCIRKGDYLNVGLGRRRAADFSRHVAAFAAFLGAAGKLPARATDWPHWKGHAYTVAGTFERAVVDGLVLIGDAAGLAVPESGEGDRPGHRVGAGRRGDHRRAGSRFGDLRGMGQGAPAARWCRRRDTGARARRGRAAAAAIAVLHPARHRAVLPAHPRRRRNAGRRADSLTRHGPARFRAAAL